MKHFYVISNESKDVDRKVLGKVVDYLKQKQVTCTVRDASPARNDRYTNASEIPEDVDCILVIGGDGTMLAAAGIAIGVLTSNETISSIGIYTGQGTLLSIFLVMCVLPQILILGDMIIRKTSFNVSMPLQPSRHGGIMRINGRVRGTISGIVDAEIHGILKGNLSGIIDVGDIEEINDEKNS